MAWANKRGEELNVDCFDERLQMLSDYYCEENFVSVDKNMLFQAKKYGYELIDFFGYWENLKFYTCLEDEKTFRIVLQDNETTKQFTIVLGVEGCISVTKLLPGGKIVTETDNKTPLKVCEFFLNYITRSPGDEMRRKKVWTKIN